MQTATLSQSSLDEIISIIERNQSKCSNLKQNISLSLSYENELARITTQFLYDLSYDLRTILAALDRSRTTNMSLSNQLQSAERTIEEKNFKIKQLEATIVDLQSALYETNRKNNELTVVNHNNQNYIEELLMKMKLNFDRRNLSFTNDDYISKNKSMISTTYEYDDCCCNGNNSFTARYPSYTNYKQLNFDYDIKDFNYNYNLNSRNSQSDEKNNSYCKSYRVDEKPLNYDYGKSVNDMNSNREYTSVFSNKRTNDYSSLNRSSNILYNNNSMDESRSRPIIRNDNQFIKTTINPEEEKKDDGNRNNSNADNNLTSDIKTIMQQRYGGGFSERKNEQQSDNSNIVNQQIPIDNNNEIVKDEIQQNPNKENKYESLTNDIKTLAKNNKNYQPQDIVESNEPIINNNVNNVPIDNTNEQMNQDNNVQSYAPISNQDKPSTDNAYTNLKNDVKTMIQRSYDNQPQLDSTNKTSGQVESNIQVNNLDSINPQFSSQQVNQPTQSVLKSKKPITSNNNIVISDNTNESQDNNQQPQQDVQPLINTVQQEQPKTLYKSKTVATPEIQAQTQELYSKYKSQRNKNAPILQEENSSHDDKTLSTDKITRVQKIVMEAFKDEDTVTKLKEKLGDDFEEKLTKAEVTEEYLAQIENALHEINTQNPQRISKRLQIAQGVNQKKKSKDIARDQLYYKTQLKRAITDKQCYYKEYPRGWNSSKDYFVNNNTSDGKMEKSTMKITTMPKQI